MITFFFRYFVAFDQAGVTPPDPAPFAPTDLANLGLWLDASDAATITLDGSNKVSQWNDKSGNGRHASQATPSARPGVSTINAEQAVNFDGSNDRLSIPHNAAFDLDSYTIFGVVKNDATDAAYSRTWLEKATSFFASDVKYWVGASGDSGVGYVQGEHSVRGGEGGAIDLLSGNTTLLPVMVSVTKNGSTDAKLHLNKSLVATDTTVSTANNTAAIGIGGTFFLWQGKIGEILFYAAVLSDVDRQKVEDYLESKWLSASPPAYTPSLNFSDSRNSMYLGTLA